MEGVDLGIGQKISIHAPVKGATNINRTMAGNPDYFNPRAREGRDVSAWECITRRRDFNPRAREGRDNLSFSIANTLLHFNPRAREGRDRDFLQEDDIATLFQSTRP